MTGGNVFYELLYTSYACSQNSENRLLASSWLFVCLSVLMEQIGSHWTGFHEFCCLSIFKKICLEISSLIAIWLEIMGQKTGL